MYTNRRRRWKGGSTGSRGGTQSPVLLGFYFLLYNQELYPKTETSHHHGWKESNFAAALGITTSESTDSVYICCTSGMEIRLIAYRPRLFPFYPLAIFPPYVIYTGGSGPVEVKFRTSGQRKLRSNIIIPQWNFWTFHGWSFHFLDFVKLHAPSQRLRSLKRVILFHLLHFFDLEFK